MVQAHALPAIEIRAHETYGAAEKAAIEIKKRHPQLHVTVFDAKEQRQALIELSKAVNGRSAANHNRNEKAVAQRKLTPAEGRH